MMAAKQAPDEERGAEKEKEHSIRRPGNGVAGLLIASEKQVKW